jgi:hypothetical protein
MVHACNGQRWARSTSHSSPPQAHSQLAGQATPRTAARNQPGRTGAAAAQLDMTFLTFSYALGSARPSGADATKALMDAMTGPSISGGTAALPVA